MSRKTAAILGAFLVLSAVGVYLVLRDSPAPHPMKVTALSESEIDATLRWEHCVPSAQLKDDTQRAAASDLTRALFGEEAEQCFASGVDSALRDHRETLTTSSPGQPRPALDPSCRKLIASVQKATGPELACSPWSATLKPFDINRDWQPLLRVAVTFGLHAWRSVQGHQSEDAIDTLLTCVRFGHDFARGKVELVRNEVSVAVSSACAQTAQALLNSPSFSLSEVDELTPWIEELAEMKNSLPHPGRTFGPTSELQWKEFEDSGDTELGGQLLQRTLHAVLIQSQRACIGVSLQACFKLLDQFSEARAKEVADTSLSPTQQALSAAARLQSKANKLAVWSALNQARGLASLQVHLHFRRFLEEFERCPDARIFLEAPFSDLMESQDAELSLQVHPMEWGFELAPTQPVEEMDSFDTWRLECNPEIWTRKAEPYEIQLAPVDKEWEQRLDAEIDKLDELHYSLSRKLLKEAIGLGSEILPEFWPTNGGFEVQEIIAGSIAARLGFESKDTIYSIDGVPIRSVTYVDLEALERHWIVVTRAEESFVLTIDIQ